MLKLLLLLFCLTCILAVEQVCHERQELIDSGSPSVTQEVKQIATDISFLLDKMEEIVSFTQEDNNYNHIDQRRANVWYRNSLDVIHNRTTALLGLQNLNSSETNTTLHKSNGMAMKHENVADIVLQFLGLMGILILWGRFSYLCLQGLFVPSLAFVCDFVRETPQVFRNVLLVPYVFIALEILGLSCIFFGQNEQSSAFFIMSTILNLCESVITNSIVLKYCGFGMILVTIARIFHQESLTGEIFYD